MYAFRIYSLISESSLKSSSGSGYIRISSFWWRQSAHSSSGMSIQARWGFIGVDIMYLGREKNYDVEKNC